MRFVTFLIAALVLPAQDIKQTGPSTWERKDTGTIVANVRGELQVRSAAGRVIVRGVPGDKISYTLTRKVRTHYDAAARRMLASAAEMRVSSTPSATTLISEGFSPWVVRQLELSIPRQIPSVVVIASGWIDARDLDGALQMNASGGNLAATGIGGPVIAFTGGGRIDLGNIRGPIHCGTGADSITVEHAGGYVDCTTQGGEIRVKEAEGTVRLVSGGGNIWVGRAASWVEAHADSGSIQVDQAGGPVNAENLQGGPIQVGAAKGVRAQSARGTVRIQGDMGPIDVAAGFGDILAELMAGALLQQSSLSAVSGDITVRIPSNFRVTVTAVGSGGWPRIVSEFPEMPTQSWFARSPGTLTGAINGGGPVLKINDPRGVIHLVRVK